MVDTGRVLIHTPLQATGEGGRRRGKGWDTVAPTDSATYLSAAVEATEGVASGGKGQGG